MSHMARPKVYSDDLRDKLLDAAVEVVADRGVGALSVREVAHLAGTSTTAVYSLLGSKTALTAGVLVRSFESFAAHQEEAVANSAPADVLAGLGAHYVGWALENPRLYELMFGGSLAGIPQSPELQAAATRAMTPLHDGVVAAIAAGFVRRDAETATVMASLWAQVHGLSMLLLSGHFPAEADPATAAMAVVDGWRPPSTRTES
ncbi:TetR family transcriptional regulator [Gordonia amarae]|uniref:TetR family transcriptional regulator n=1 Tax=Gordonia amarae TaxID=36821 RepID=A0A857L652_9ACTN|nr:TetR/AcrR family transcriptional regulator [Gordonia amarae]QHN20022.1 TetR family transcriptional regulator [Gordonia amarae]QHN24480.1 TetR family transcriptional regulator [Gordonia amarae]QHN33406.1 TetR family transcriptional regulator [Gordonia amarae]QHN42127.1 TetR family transcriptional regulator [Gordonia amarae]